MTTTTTATLAQVVLSDTIGNEDNYEKRVKGTVTRQASIAEGLTPVEDLIKKLAPLPASYDVGRTQPLYYSEFTYTEFLGNAVFVCPQNSEMASRMVRRAAALAGNIDDPKTLAIDILKKTGAQDKYSNLVLPDNKRYPSVAFLPGSNILWKLINEDVLRRALHEDSELVLKLHPITSVEDIRKLKLIAGLPRLIEPSWSGYTMAINAERVYATSSTELAIYAYLKGKPVYNIGQFITEYQGAYNPLFSLATTTPVRSKDPSLLGALSNPLSGVFFKSDPNLESNIKAYFDAAMEMREMFAPASSEMAAMNK